MSLLGSKKLLIILAILAFGTLIYSFIPKGAIAPVLSSINPLNRSIQFPIKGNIVASYNIPVTASEFVVSSIPEEDWVITQLGSNQLQFSPRGQLDRLTQYTLAVTWRDQFVHNHILTTQDTQQDYEVIEKVKNEIARNYPLADKIPYSEPGFSVQYSKELTLEITLKSDSVAPEDVLRAVREWVRGNGLDPESHSYTFAN